MADIIGEAAIAVRADLAPLRRDLEQARQYAEAALAKTTLMRTPIVGKDGTSLLGSMSGLGSAAAAALGTVTSAIASVTVAASAVAAGGGIAGLLGLGQAALAASDAEEAMLQLGAAIEAAGRGSEFSADGLSKLASDLQSSTRFEDDSLKKIMARLVSFEEIGTESFERVMRAALDMSSAGFGDAESAALSLAKALTDPTAGLTALRKSGIVFTEAQRDVIKSLAETGQMAAAQEKILSAVEGKFGGMAVRMAGGFRGALDQLRNSFGDSLENLGAPLLQHLTPVLQEVRVSVEQLSAWLADNGDVIGRWGGQVMRISRDVLGGLATAISGALDAVARFSTGGQLDQFFDWSKFSGGLSTALDALEMFTQNWSKTWDALTLSSEIGFRSALAPVRGFIEESWAALSRWAKGVADLFATVFDPKNWSAEGAANIGVRVGALTADVLTFQDGLLAGAIDRANAEGGVLAQLRQQRDTMLEQMRIAQQLRAPQAMPAMRAVALAAGMVGVGGMVEQQANPGAFAAQAFAKANLGGQLMPGMVGGGGGMAGAAEAMRPGPAMGPLGFALAGGGPAVAELLAMAVAEGAQEGTAKGQQMGLRDYHRAIQDAVFGQEEKSNWTKLLDWEKKQHDQMEAVKKGVEALAKKKFSIFGGD